MKQVLIIVCLVLTSACMVGPDYKPPERQLPTAWETQADYPEMTEADHQWWSTYQDPALSKLIERAEAANHDIRIAMSRVAEARAGVMQAKGSLLPEVNSQASISRGKASENGQEPGATFFRQGLASPYQTLYNAGFDSSWEFDLFGRLKRGIESANAGYDVATAGVAQARLTVSSETARLYFLYLALHAREQTVERRIDIREQIADLVEVRRDAGLVSDLDLVQVTALVSQAKAQLPGLSAEKTAVLNGLASLLDWKVDELAEQITIKDILPVAPEGIALATPVSLLSRRPDLVLAERRLAQSVADIGVAEGNLYPRISIAALFGLEATSASEVFDGDSFTGMITPQISIPIFNRYRIRAGINAAEARRDGAMASFEKAVNGALADVQTAIARHEGFRETLVAIRDSEADSRKALEMARELYDLGLRDFQVVLDTERILTEVIASRIDAETEVLVSSVALFKAMGGGWR